MLRAGFDVVGGDDRIGKRLVRHDALVAFVQQGAQLAGIAQSVLRVDEDPMRVAHRRDADRRVIDTGNMDQTGACGKQAVFTGQYGVERVAHQRQFGGATQFLQRPDRLRFAAHGTFDKTQRFDQSAHAVRLQHRQQAGQGMYQVIVATLWAALILSAVGRAQHNRLGTAVGGKLQQFGCFFSRAASNWSKCCSALIDRIVRPNARATAAVSAAGVPSRVSTPSRSLRNSIVSMPRRRTMAANAGKGQRAAQMRLIAKWRVGDMRMLQRAIALATSGQSRWFKMKCKF